MMGLKSMMQKAAPHLNKVIAEEAFKLGAVALTSELDPGDLRHMAENDMSFSDLLESLGYEVPTVDTNGAPRVAYIQSCSDEHLLGLLDEVIPELVAVLKEYPAYAASMCADLRKLIGGSNAGNGD